MRRLVTEVITEAQRRMPDMNSTVALENYNTINTRLHEKLELNRTSTIIPCPPDVTEFQIDSSLYPIYQVTFSTSANDSRELQATELSLLESYHEGFRNMPSSMPARYYTSHNETGATLNIIPASSIDYEDEYPRLTVYHSKTPDFLTSATDAYIPPALPQDGAVYWVGMVMLFAELRQMEAANYWQQRFQQELARCYNYLYRRNIKVKPQLTAMPLIQRRTI